jgi:hypothetical protein
MVVGKTSNFIEGFETITVDEDTLLTSLKQAVLNSKQKQPINALINSNSVSISNMQQKPMQTMPPLPPPAVAPLQNTQQQSGASLLQMPPSQMPPSQMPLSTMPQSQMPPSQMQPSQMPQSQMLPSQMPQSQMPPSQMPQLQMPQNVAISKFKNIKQKAKFIDIKNEVDDDSNDTDNPNQEDNDDNDDNEDNNTDDEDTTNTKKKIEGFRTFSNKHKKSTDIEEGFNGSVIIEGMNYRNILLGLLITFFAYLTMYAQKRNLLNISKWFPQLNKFSNIIYYGLLFLIIYICLVVF